MSYTYTTYPIPSVDTANSHFGFYLVAAIVALIYFFYVTDSESKGSWLKGLLISSAVVGASALFSWNTGVVAVYENTPVTAKLVNFQAEGRIESQRSGKHTRQVDVHFTYVIYEVPDGGRVMLRAHTGHFYPESAILYRNPSSSQ